MKYTKWNPSDILEAMRPGAALVDWLRRPFNGKPFASFDDALAAYPSTFAREAAVTAPHQVLAAFSHMRPTLVEWPAFRQAVHDALVAEAVRLGVPKRAR